MVVVMAVDIVNGNGDSGGQYESISAQQSSPKTNQPPYLVHQKNGYTNNNTRTHLIGQWKLPVKFFEGGWS